MQKHELDEVKNESTIFSQYPSGICLPKVVKIEQRLTKLYPAAEEVVFFSVTMYSSYYPRRARSALGVDTVLTLDVCLYVCMFVCMLVL